MKTIKVETKKAGQIEVQVYASVAEYIKSFGETETIKNLNRMVRVDLVNAANRDQSTMSQLKNATKAGLISEGMIMHIIATAKAKAAGTYMLPDADDDAGVAYAKEEGTYVEDDDSEESEG